MTPENHKSFDSLEEFQNPTNYDFTIGELDVHGFEIIDFVTKNSSLKLLSPTACQHASFLRCNKHFDKRGRNGKNKRCQST